MPETMTYLQAARKRPGMYVEDVSQRGFLHILGGVTQECCDLICKSGAGQHQPFSKCGTHVGFDVSVSGQSVQLTFSWYAPEFAVPDDGLGGRFLSPDLGPHNCGIATANAFSDECSLSLSFGRKWQRWLYRNQSMVRRFAGKRGEDASDTATLVFAYSLEDPLFRQA